MDAIEFLRDFRRMCSSYDTCADCELDEAQCRPMEEDCDHEKMICVVEQWAKEHPVKTRLSELLKVLPNCHRVQGYPDHCILAFDSKQKCLQSGCLECKKKFWLTPIEEEEE